MSINRLGSSFVSIKPARRTVKSVKSPPQADSFVAPLKFNTFSTLKRTALPSVVSLEEKDASAPWWSKELSATVKTTPHRLDLFSQSFIGTSSLSDILQSMGSKLSFLSVNLFHEVD